MLLAIPLSLGVIGALTIRSARTDLRDVPRLPLALAGVGIALQVLVGLMPDQSPVVLRGLGAVDLLVGVVVALVAFRDHVPPVLRIGFGATGGGIALNALPVALLGAMPVSQRAAAHAGVAPELLTTPASGYVWAADTPPVLAAFGDWLPVSPLEKVVSIGDLALIAGLSVLVAVWLRSGWTPDDGAATPPA